MASFETLSELKTKYGRLKGFPNLEKNAENKDLQINHSSKSQKLLLTKSLALGDEVCRTAMLRDLHLTYPGKYITDIETGLSEVWENNPFITKLDPLDPEVKAIECNYSTAINQSDRNSRHFIDGYSLGLSESLGINIQNHGFKGDIYISEEEKGWISQVEETGWKGEYWILVSGFKDDYQTKALDPNVLQEIVNYFEGKIKFVQVGQESDYFPILENTINLIGKTSIRELIRMVYHAQGILCGTTSLMHLAAAVPLKDENDYPRACVVLASGMENELWEKYPWHEYLSKIFSLKCCSSSGCWKSKTNPSITSKNELSNMCVNPIEIKWNGKMTPPLEKLNGVFNIGKCINDISTLEIVLAVEKYINREKK